MDASSVNFIRRLDKIQHDRAETTDGNVFQAIRGSTPLKEKVTLDTSLAETIPIPKLSPMENGDLNIKVALGKERGQGLAVSHRPVPALGASNGNFDRAMEPCLAEDDACDGLQIGVVGEAAQGILVDTSVRSQVGVMLRIPKSLQRNCCSERSIASEVGWGHCIARTGTLGYHSIPK